MVVCKKLSCKVFLYCFVKSVDGGLTYASPLVTPASGNPIALDVGVNITFVDYATPSESFQVGDEWTIVIHAPGASNLSRLTALEKLKYEYDAYFIHILGESNRAFAVSVNSLLNQWVNGETQLLCLQKRLQLIHLT